MNCCSIIFENFKILYLIFTIIYFSFKIIKCIKEKIEKKALFVLIPNEIINVDDIDTCCNKKCINNDLKNGSCVNKNGYINIWTNEKIHYVLAKENGKNDLISVSAKNSFSRANCYSKSYSLFYYEVKIFNELIFYEDFAAIGFDNDAVVILSNYTCINSGFQKFSWEDGDVFGCGVVFQPNKELYTIVFFTKNGQKIGYPIFLKEIDILRPCIGLNGCSVETNFGNDLVTKPFIYDVNNHFC